MPNIFHCLFIFFDHMSTNLLYICRRCTLETDRGVCLKGLSYIIILIGQNLRYQKSYWFMFWMLFSWFWVLSFEKITNYHISPTAISNHLNNKNRQYFETTPCTFDVDAKYNSMPLQKVVWQAACWGVIAAAWPQDNNTRYSFTLKRNHISSIPWCSMAGKW